MSQQGLHLQLLVRQDTEDVITGQLPCHSTEDSVDMCFRDTCHQRANITLVNSGLEVVSCQ